MVTRTGKWMWAVPMAVAALSTASCISAPVTTAVAEADCPVGWQTPTGGTAPGYRLCLRNRATGETAVQIVDLSAGARIAVVSDVARNSGTPEAIFVKRAAHAWWDWTLANAPSPAGELQAVVNASFFMDVFPATETALSFTQLRGSEIDTIGADPDDRHAMAALSFSADGAQARISNFPVRPRGSSNYAAALAGADSALVSFAADAGPVATRRTRRTFVGGRDSDRDGALDQLFVLTTTELLTARDVLTILAENFGSEAAIQFDGGGSTQFHGRAGHMRSAECALPLRGCRTVPNVLAIYAGPSQ